MGVCRAATARFHAVNGVAFKLEWIAECYACTCKANQRSNSGSVITASLAEGWSPRSATFENVVPGIKCTIPPGDVNILCNSFGSLKTATSDFEGMVLLAAIEGGNVQVRRVGKWFFTALGSLAVLLAIGITSTIGWSPFLGTKARALTDRIFERTPQPLVR